MPQEAMLEVKKTGEKIIHRHSEGNFLPGKPHPAYPRSIAVLIGDGHQIIVETGAGKAIEH